MNSNNKRIAKNTVYLYCRKLLTLALALYTSRILLHQLGIEEYGLYGLVGSIIAMFSALRGMFSSSIQRFVNISKGRGKNEEVNRIFSIGMNIHIILAIIFFIVLEVVGIIMLPHLNISTGKEVVAMWILQFSILTAIVSILTIPYDALIIANERFEAYAALSVLNYILNLVIVYFLAISPFNKVVVYSILLFVVAVIIRILNSLYCKINFKEEARYKRISDKKLMHEMGSFAGWQFFGNSGYTLTNNGINFILNFFGGIIVNAARSIAYQVMQAIMSFIGDISVSFTPRIMMCYASNDIYEFQKLTILSTKTSFSICIIIAFPILLFTHNILQLWLAEVPEYSISFIKALLLYLIIRSFHQPIDTIFKSKGNIKSYQLIEFSIMILNLPLSYIALKFKFPYYSVFLIMAIVEIINLTAILILAKKQLSFNLKQYFKDIIYPSLVCVILLFLTYISINHYFYADIKNLNLWDSIILIIVCLLFTIMLISISVYNKEERSKAISLLNPLCIFKKNS